MSAIASELRAMADGQSYNQRERMREAANRIEYLERAAEVYAAERDMARLHRDRMADILTRIHAKLGGERFVSEGVTYVFNPQDKAMYWPVYDALCREIRAIPDELAAAMPGSDVPSHYSSEPK